MRTALTRAVSVAAFMAIAGCTPGQVARPNSTPAQSPAQAATANWRTYTSYAYGYTFKYPPQWFEAFGGPAGSVDFSTEQDVNAPLQMSPAGVFVDLSPYCVGKVPDGVVEQKTISLSQMTVTRTVVDFNPPASERAGIAAARINVGEYCCTVEMIGQSLAPIRANLNDFDLVLASMKFGARTAPVITPPGF